MLTLCALAISFLSPREMYSDGSAAVKPPSGFGFVCAQPDTAISTELRLIVADLMSKYGHQGGNPWPDRSVQLRLRAVDTVVHMIPLSCGATGNCTWGILATSPARTLGVVDGSVIHVQDTEAGWPNIDAYSGYGAGEGDLTTYVFRDDSYRKLEVGKLKPDAVGRFQSCVDNQACCPKSAT